MKNNTTYTTKELLQNDSFLRWQLFPTPEDEAFWTKYLEENPEAREQVEAAIAKVGQIRLNDYTLSDTETQTMFAGIQQRITHKHKRRRLWLATAASTAAAIGLLLIFSGIFTRQAEEHLPETIAHTTQPVADSKDIRMIIGEESIALAHDADFEYNKSGNVVVSSDNKEIISKKISEEAIAQNKLIVPKGKRSSLTLADGTKIWVNSGSTLEFPAVFPDDKREIHVDGEIYIEVQKDTERPFIVHTDRLAVTVLGTHFNVSAYGDDTSNSVVLVEGSVKVSAGSETVTLKPDQMASVADKAIQTRMVNVYDYTSWKDGVMQFSSEPLAGILTRLGRYYDKTISCEESIENLKCTGKLVLFDGFEAILETISHTMSVNYTVTDDEIYIHRE